MIPTIEHSGKDKSIETVERLVMAEVQGEERKGGVNRWSTEDF